MIFSETAFCHQKMFWDSCTRPCEGQLTGSKKRQKSLVYSNLKEFVLKYFHMGICGCTNVCF